MIKLIFLFIYLLLIACTSDQNARSYRLAKKTAIISKKINNSNKLIWEKPESWIVSNGSSMRLASFIVPYSKGTGDLSVIKLNGDGGGLELNINRWRKQLNMDPINLIEINKNIKTHNGRLGTYNIYQIINNNIESAFLCAIISITNYTIFVKLSIQPFGLNEVKEDFITFCSSLNIN